ncbi:hypothetical protein Noc_0707 [Nitrosococcus oceani ATCC 19707]|uniref:Uncharacterized protein n=2 Tax=Nitrosococcus oceani TaxID=1229 RepID=Q3JD75_NITOC|nr:hypothetical protein [Nitrosococcus oceani]ABA57221.1 hypothetical protein Noc_0707 [Nitrosococcus oceani ATCC 19707]EDZ65510.1 hypothetical protein NOC27_2190 [Nitrosococcus oceani AFC27]KFI20355.1 hypothetical protein IB75_03555 [Nitrosococcus oceani C-27]GEM21657.1 hypothetical protein NONS58_31060 [Nitrosococcus oceani]
MSTINRIEIANFLNLNGEGEAEIWEPRYRAVTFNFHGQSTALNMTNGVGKTSNVEAWLALLTRDPQLISRTREKMAPERDGYYSHIRIEFVVPERGATVHDDLFVQQGSPVGGKETWVFGMYGYRSAGSINFYYYRGSLGQVPVADTTTRAVALLPNQEFRAALKAAERNRHNPVREDWIAELSLHVSPVSMRRQAEYQKRGGGDKSAELFALKSRKGENYDVTFFYEIIAPELLSGLMDREGEEGEHELEDTILNAVMDVIRTRHNTLRKKIELEKVKEVLGVLDENAGKAAEAEQAQGQYEQQRTRMAQDVALLQNLVQQQPLPGIPESPSGKDLIDRLKASIIIELGNRDYRVLDAGIAGLTGESVRALNQRAHEARSEGRKIPQAIVIPCDSSSGERSSLKPNSYTPAVARDLVESSSRWANGLTRQMALGLLEDLERWFLSDAAHRNPYRTERNELEYDIEQLGRDLSAQQERSSAIAQELDGLRDQQTRMKEDEAAYRDVQASGEFTEEEWSDPGRTAEQVVIEYQKADQARMEFLGKKARIEVWKPQWDDFIRRFPEEPDPEIVHQQHQEAKGIAAQHLDEASRQKEQAEDEGRALHAKASEGESAATSYRTQAERFDRLDGALGTYAKEFGNESPTRLDNRVVQEKVQAEADINATREKIARFQSMADDLMRFYSETGASSPTDWLSACEKKRAKLQARKPVVERERSELIRQRQDLEEEQVAANPSARQALDYLDAADVPFSPLHRAIEAMGLDGDRRRGVLSCFSAVLFAPVVATDDAALAAAACLAEHDVQIPVFMVGALESFAREGDLKADKDQDFYYGLIAGVTTRAVACLLDPGLVEREKERLDSLIGNLVQEAGQIERRLKATAESAPLIVLARKAQLAVEANAESELTRHSEHLRTLEDRLPILKRRASDESLNAIRAAQEFDRLGGQRKRDEVIRNLEEQKRRLDDLRRREEQNRTQREALVQEVSGAQQRLEVAYPADLRVLLEQAKEFSIQGGVEFLKSAPRREQELAEVLNRANARKEYRLNLVRAVTYLAAIQRAQAGEDINELIAKKKGELKQARTEVARVSGKRDELIARCEPLDDAMKAVDQAAQLALQHFQPASRVALDLPGRDIDREQLESNEIFQQADSLRVAVERGYDLAEVVRQAETLQDLLSQLEIERDLQELRRLKNQSDNHRNTFLESVHQASKYEGLGDVERERLQTVRDLSGTQLVIAMARDIREIYERERSLYEQAAEAESESRSLVTKRIGYFIESAQDNLDLFKRVARAKHGNESAHFQVSADMISREESEALIENIISTLDEEEAARKKRQKRGMENTESGDQYRGRLRDLIRQNTYRRIFRSPSVKYVSPHIRNDERPRSLTRSLSSGQRTAMTLQWIIRLAEFAISRELQGSISRVSARRRARERAQSILFIDGLFSDLSDEQLIREAMSGIRNTRGRFQLIGLIHNTKYTNDFDVFPVLLLGKVITSLNGFGGWVIIDENNEETSTLADTVQVAELRKEVRPAENDR